MYTSCIGSLPGKLSITPKVKLTPHRKYHLQLEKKKDVVGAVLGGYQDKQGKQRQDLYCRFNVFSIGNNVL